MLTKREKLRKYLKHWRRLLFSRTKSPAIPVFVFGEMRSGTNMLIDCLDASAATDVYNETDDQAFSDYELRDLVHVQELIDTSSGTHVVFKAIADSNRADDILNTFPSARAFWIYRKFEDVVNSAVSKWTQHNEYLRLIMEDPEKARWRARNLSTNELDAVRHHYSRGLDEASARALIWYLRNQFYFSLNLHSDARVRLLNYEALVMDPRRHLALAFEFLGLPFDESSFQHISTRSVAKNPAPQFDRDVFRMCTELKERLDSHAHRVPINSVHSDRHTDRLTVERNETQPR